MTKKKKTGTSSRGSDVLNEVIRNADKSHDSDEVTANDNRGNSSTIISDIEYISESSKFTKQQSEVNSYVPSIIPSGLDSVVSNPLRQIDAIQESLGRSKIIFQRIRVYLFLFTFLFLLMVIGLITYFYSHKANNVKMLNPNPISSDSEESAVSGWLFQKQRAPWNLAFFPLKNFDDKHNDLNSYLPAIVWQPLLLTYYHHLARVSFLFEQRDHGSSTLWTSTIGSCIVDDDTSVLITKTRTDVFALAKSWSFSSKFVICNTPIYVYNKEQYYADFDIKSITFSFCSISLVGTLVNISFTIPFTSPIIDYGEPLLMYPRIFNLDNNSQLPKPFDLDLTITVNKDVPSGNTSSRKAVIHTSEFDAPIIKNLTALTISLSISDINLQKVLFVINDDSHPAYPNNANIAKTVGFDG